LEYQRKNLASEMMPTERKGETALIKQTATKFHFRFEDIEAQWDSTSWIMLIDATNNKFCAGNRSETSFVTEILRKFLEFLRPFAFTKPSC
jgi:hypothetical protein